MKRADVSALYVDSRAGPYPALLCDYWDINRDAMRYDGPNPIVCHPPCGSWGRMVKQSRQPLRPGLVAVEQVRRWGGVLEHPADSKLWKRLRLPYVNGLPDAWGGFTICVNQWNFGHLALKKTWLYIVGYPQRHPLPDRPHLAAPGYPKNVQKLSKIQRRKTPFLFAKWLIEIAARCKND